MAKLDQFIDALYQRNASRLIVAAGEPAALAFGDGATPVTSSPLRAELVKALVAEVAPSEAKRRLVADESVSFSYRAPAGTVTISSEQGGDGARFHVVPAAPEGTAAPGGTTAPGNGAARAAGEGAPAAASAPDPALREPDRTAASTAGATAAPADGAAASAATAAGQVTRGPRTEAMDRLFLELFEGGCSDLHLTAGNPPLFRKDGTMVTLSQTSPLTAKEVGALLGTITPPMYQEEFDRTNDADFSYEIPEVARFRCNLFRDRNGPGGVFRVIPNKTPSAEDLGLSPHILKLCMLSKGLVLVTGPTGSGKSTTLAAMVDYINRNRSEHIITIEDPIEFVHANKKCLINQREVGNHTTGFKRALRAALREDPDIVLVGEMRDLETVEIAIETAETGHLVFGTLHTNTAASTVDRIIDQFPPERQGQIRSMLASSLKGVIAQTLCKKKAGGRVAALEVLIVNAAVANLVREGKTFQIPSIMQTGAKIGMSTLNDALMKLVKQKSVEPDQAYAKAVDRQEFLKLLERNGMPLTVPAGEE